MATALSAWAAAASPSTTTSPTPPTPGVSVILPPGESGFVSVPAFLHNQQDGDCRDFGPHFCDRLGPYLAWQWDDGAFRTRDRSGPGDTVEELRGGRVRIVRDAATGSPHIWGDPDPSTSGSAADVSSVANMAYGFGVAQAEDRLFQLEVFRRAAEGTLSELLGPSMLGYDERYRRDTETNAERDADIAAHLGSADLAALDGYVAGVNTVITRTRTDPTHLPAEFSLLADVPIRPWTREDCLAIGTLEIKAEAEAGGQELVVAADLQKLANPAAVLADWYFREDPATPSSIPMGPSGSPAVYPFSPADTDARLAALPPGLATWSEAGLDATSGSGGPAVAAVHANDVVRAIFALGLPRFGSNAVAIGPAHTTTGGALLYGGPQAGYDVPSVFWMVEAHARGIDVQGVAVPGSGPVVAIGHTPHHAWSITTGQDDQVDSYLERVRRNPAGRGLQVWFQGTWQPVESRLETYRYRAVNNPLPVATSVAPPVYLTATATVYRTRHAGIPSPIVAIHWDPGGQAGWALSKTRAFWATAARTGVVFEGIVRARSAAEFGAAVSGTPPAFNFVYADVNGHIGYWHTGYVPLRAPGHDPRLPATGDGSMEWRGYLDPARWPHAIDPAAGWVASWNNRAALDFPDSGDGTVWGSFQRVLGIQRDLADRLAATPIDAAGLATVMQAVGSHDLNASLFFRDVLLRLRQPGTPTLSVPARAALARVTAWNQNVYYPLGANAQTVRDPGATIFDRWFADLEDAVLRHVFAPVGPTPWSVNAFDDTTTGAADGGRDEYDSNVEPVVLHAVEAVPSIPLHLDWLPPAATGASRLARIDAVSAAALEQAVRDLSGPAPGGFGTIDQARWLQPTHTTSYLSLGAGTVPDQPFENRGVFGFLVAFPGPASGSTTGLTSHRPGGPRTLPATGPHFAWALMGAILVAAGTLVARRGGSTHGR